MAGERAGFTIEQMIQLLNAGLTVESLLDIITEGFELLGILDYGVAPKEYRI